ncbi:PucR family transcriptional regulator [Acrocarpospora catenulata]|uniref:PucR family transcriptional regulator n=1 Tax=Acrocarpospora catenulata TaxID=2836182 RepID=UPI002023ABE3|nr:PucR family transcriptional regulator [Acrocarpospora catenulata]
MAPTRSTRMASGTYHPRRAAALGIPLELVLANEALGLTVVAGAEWVPNRHVKWATVSELPDPRHSLIGGDLLLTTGISQNTAARQRAFVEHAAEGGASCLAYATQFSFDTIPGVVLETAREYRLPVLEVPWTTSFATIGRYIASQVVIGRSPAFTYSANIYEKLASDAQGEGGLAAIAAQVAKLVRGSVWISDATNTTVAEQAWVPEQGEGATSDAPRLYSMPLVHGDVFLGQLTAEYRNDSANLLRFAGNLAALVLAKESGRLEGMRHHIGQIIDDILAGDIPASEARRRLLRYGLDVDQPCAVVLGETMLGKRRLEPALLHHGIGENVRRDLLLGVHPNGRILAIARSEVAAEQFARRLFSLMSAISPMSRVGIGGTYKGVEGVRTSFLEAREALKRGYGVNTRKPLSFLTSVLTQDKEHLRRVVEDTLAPLRGDDQQSVLLETLKVYFQERCSVVSTAEVLFVHRNTVKYRLAQIEALTGLDLSDVADVSQLWFALAAMDDQQLGGA